MLNFYQWTENKKISIYDLSDVIAGHKALLTSFRGGGIPKSKVEEQLNKLPAMTQPELLELAKAINSAATLTPKSPKAKIIKQISEMINRVWKTSDNVNH